MQQDFEWRGENFLWNEIDEEFDVFSLFSEHVLLYPLDVLRRQIQVRLIH